ncbi:hypothetical protein ABPG75_011357 [Micractinium tetrahymenae]
MQFQAGCSGDHLPSSLVVAPLPTSVVSAAFAVLMVRCAPFAARAQGPACSACMPSHPPCRRNNTFSIVLFLLSTASLARSAAPACNSAGAFCKLFAPRSSSPCTAMHRSLMICSPLIAICS